MHRVKHLFQLSVRYHSSSPSKFNPTPKPSVKVNCRRSPSISHYIDLIDEKCTDVTDRARDYYVDHLDFTTTVEDFAQELKERIEPDFKECRSVIANSRESLRKSLNLTREDFNNGYWNGGFLNTPMSCYNRVILLLRVEEEKMKGYIDAAVEQLNWLFTTYFEKKVKKGKKT